MKKDDQIHDDIKTQNDDIILEKNNVVEEKEEPKKAATDENKKGSKPKDKSTFLPDNDYLDIVFVDEPLYDDVITVCKYSISKSNIEERHASFIRSFEKTVRRRKNQERIDKDRKEIEKNYHEAIDHFEKLKVFLRKMLDKYGQTYYTGNGGHGIVVTDEEISLVLKTPGLSDTYIDYPNLPDYIDEDDSGKDVFYKNAKEIFDINGRLDGSYPPGFLVAIAITIGKKLYDNPDVLMFIDYNTSVTSVETSLNTEELNTLVELMTFDYMDYLNTEKEYLSTNTLIRCDKSEEEKYAEYQKQLKREITRKLYKYKKNCVIVKSIPDFNGKTFVASGFKVTEKGRIIGEEIKNFLSQQGAFLRQEISGKTDYLIVYPENAGSGKYKAVLEQAKKGHTVEVIFYEDFSKYMNVTTDSAYSNDEPDETV